MKLTGHGSVAAVLILLVRIISRGLIFFSDDDLCPFQKVLNLNQFCQDPDEKGSNVLPPNQLHKAAPKQQARQSMMSFLPKETQNLNCLANPILHDSS